MAAPFSINSAPYPTLYVPFTNETEVQSFVEEHTKDIFGLDVIASTRRGRRRLFDIDVLAIDEANRPFIFECKWDLVDAGALDQLARYKDVLLSDWARFETRVSEVRHRPIQVKRREPVLIIIGYRYDPSVLSQGGSVISLTYAYHHPTMAGEVLTKRRPGEVSIQRPHEAPMPVSRHPSISKKHRTFARLAPLPQTLQDAFWDLDAKLQDLPEVTVVYGGKNFVRYRVRKSAFAEAKVGPMSIQWRLRWSKHEGVRRADGELSGRVEMLPASDVDKIYDILRDTYSEVG
jgi:hypothetical protein